MARYRCCELPHPDIHIWLSTPKNARLRQHSPAGDAKTNSERERIKTLSLKRVYHHGSDKFPKLFRRLDVNETLLNTLEQTSGRKFTHTVQAVPGKAFKPHDVNRVKEYRQRHRHENISILMNYYRTETMVPDMESKESVIELAKMTYDAYIPPTNDDWYDLGDKYQWKDEFGWDTDGIRGHVFADEQNKTVIITFKGTTMIYGPTVPKDKKNDNRLFSCCCGRVGPSWKPVCDCYLGDDNRCSRDCLEDSVDEDDMYYNIATETLFQIQEDFPNATFWLTGHSLGGGLSSLLGWTYGIPTVAYEAPGERLAAQRLHLPGPPALPYDSMPIWHVGHTADPIFMGACTGFGTSCWLGGYAMETHCHHGLVCLYDPVKELNWTVDIRTHRVKEVIEKVLEVWKEVPSCEPEHECDDCGLWNFE